MSALKSAYEASRKARRKLVLETALQLTKRKTKSVRIIKGALRAL